MHENARHGQVAHSRESIGLIDGQCNWEVSAPNNYIQPALSPSYLKKIVVLLYENVQEPEEGRGGEADYVVVVTFDFPYEQPTEALYESSVVDSRGLDVCTRMRTCIAKPPARSSPSPDST